MAGRISAIVWSPFEACAPVPANATLLVLRERDGCLSAGVAIDFCGRFAGMVFAGVPVVEVVMAVEVSHAVLR
jgi:hypothetical protein